MVLLNQELVLLKEQNARAHEELALLKEQKKMQDVELKRMEEKDLRDHELYRELSRQVEGAEKKRKEEQKQLAKEMRERELKRIKIRWKEKGEMTINKELRKRKYRKDLKAMIKPTS